MLVRNHSIAHQTERNFAHHPKLGIVFSAENSIPQELAGKFSSGWVFNGCRKITVYLTDMGGTGLPCCDWGLLQRLGCMHQAALLPRPITPASWRLPYCGRPRRHERLYVRATSTGTEPLSQGGTQKTRRDLKLDNLEAAWTARQQRSAGNDEKASTSGRPPAGSGPRRAGRGAGSSTARGGGRAGAQGGASAAPGGGRRRPGKAPVTTERLAKVSRNAQHAKHGPLLVNPLEFLVGRQTGGCEAPFVMTRRVQVIARAGIASRRAAEELVTAGRVKVNGEKVLLPQHQVRATSDKVGVNVPRCSKRGERL